MSDRVIIGEGHRAMLLLAAIEAVRNAEAHGDFVTLRHRDDPPLPAIELREERYVNPHTRGVVPPKLFRK